MGNRSNTPHPAQINNRAANRAATQAEKPIADSWSRCIETYGLSPTERHATVVLEAPEIQDHRAPMEYLLSITDREMKNLYEATAGSGYAVILTDRHGIILHHVCDPGLRSEFQEAGLWLGANWGEQQEGTNGIGTCIVEQQPITVHRDEHFRRRNVGLTCSAAPVFDPHGNLLAVLDSSACSNKDSRNSQAHVRALVQMSAIVISNCNFLRHFRNDYVLRFHSRPEYVGLLNEGMLALNQAGKVLAANRAALLLLHRTGADQLLGKNISEIMDITAELIQARVSSHVSSLWPVREINKGRRFFAMLYGRTATPSAPPSTGPNRNVALDLDAVAGGDHRMQKNTSRAAKVMNKHIPIILLGETGTGKEVMARAIHNASNRASNPFVAVNCSSIPESLIESELFGYRHGAFTGARREGMKGKILESSGGTLFLDEIGDMPAELQTRLLRVIEDNQLTPLGADKPTPVDLNVISATHRDLKELIAEGSFREDLYYRLNGISLVLPPLRDRQDKRALIRFIIDQEREPDQIVELAECTLSRLENYTWPGNIRQLKNVLRTALAISEDGGLDLDDLTLHDAPVHNVALDTPPASQADDQEPEAVVTSSNPLHAAEKEAILLALAANCWNITNTAAQLKMSRNTLYRKLKKHGLPQSKPQ